MREPNIVDYNLQFGYLYRRPYTNLIVIHHTGNLVDDDLSAEVIHGMHKNNRWSGIGYHFVVRKDGTIERGRPLWAAGAHAEEYNPHSVAVHLCGNFELAFPTDKQIEAAAYLIGWLCERYELVPDRDHVVGHCDLLPTACPGKFLYEKLQILRGKAIWYQQHY